MNLPKGFLAGMLELGAFLGCLVYPKLADVVSRKWGLTIAVGRNDLLLQMQPRRKRLIWFNTVIFTIGSIIQTVAPDYGASERNPSWLHRSFKKVANFAGFRLSSPDAPSEA